jgi:hypothetical protein
MYIWNMTVIVELLYRTWGGGIGKKNDKESTILKYISSVQVNESCLIMGEKGKGYGRVIEGTELTKVRVYSQL